MVNSFSNPDREVENSKQTTGGDLSDNNRDNNIIYTNDSDGAYHVEQDDETEEESFVERKR
jgi:hypothetical protein